MKLLSNNKFYCFLSVLGVVLGGASANKKLIMAETDALDGKFIVLAKCGNSKTDSFSVQTMQSLIASAGTSTKCTHVFKHTICGCAVEITVKEAEAISKLSDVESVQQDQKIVKALDTDVTSWGLDRIDQRDPHLDNRYNKAYNGGGVDAYIIDTGIYIEHKDFDGRAKYGANFVDGETDGDCHGHGTHVAGTVGGKTYGVADKVNLIAVKVLGCDGGGTMTGLLAGIDWVADEAQKSGKPSTANLSIGTGVRVKSFNDAVRALHRRGVVTVVAAGNDDMDARYVSPGSEPEVLTVGASTALDTRASFSNWGEALDIFAPGEDITSAWIGGDTEYNTISGTSMAAPHVCGAAALYLGEGMNADAVTKKIIDGATLGVIENRGKGSPNKLLYLQRTNEDDVESFEGGDYEYDDEPNYFWDIEMLSAEEFVDYYGRQTIDVLYHSSVRDFQVEVFQEDCETTTGIFDEDIYIYEDEESEFMMYTSVALYIDQEKIKGSPLKTDNGFAFCVASSLVAPDEDNTVVTKKKTRFSVTVTNEATFDINVIEVVPQDVEEQEVSITQAVTLKAFECDRVTLSPITPNPLGPFDPLTVCVKVDEADEDWMVAGIQDLELIQEGTGVEFTAIENGDPQAGLQDLVQVNCGVDTCRATVQLFDQFFLNAQRIYVKGKATLNELNGRKLNLNLPVKTSSLRQGGWKENRNLEDGEGEGGKFGVNVELIQPCKEGEDFLRTVMDVLRV